MLESIISTLSSGNGVNTVFNFPHCLLPFPFGRFNDDFLEMFSLDFVVIEIVKHPIFVSR